MLFADLVGFTGLSEDADPENVKRLIDTCFQQLVADVRAFGGTVDKILGDAIMALFGAPTAHEDDPERALRAAFRMRRSLESVSVERGLDLRLCIGINTGEVLAGALTAGGDYTAMGDTVNIASRLQEMASAGEVLVGPETRSATVNVVDYTERGELTIRGRDEPLEVFVATGELAPPGRRRSSARTPLIGRNLELGQLSAAVATAVARRRAHHLQVVGEAGMGKTRLAEEVAEAAETQHGAIVLDSMVLAYDEANPLRAVGDAIAGAAGVELDQTTEEASDTIEQLIRQALSAPAHTVEADANQLHAHGGAASFGRARGGAERSASTDERHLDSQVAEATDLILAMIGRVQATTVGAASPTGDLDARTEATFTLLSVLFAALARQQPTILLLGDIHWADDRLYRLLERLLADLGNLPFVLITTARWDLDEPRWLAPVGRHSTVTMNLDPLSRDATAELVKTLLGFAPPPAMADQLHARSGGNPFFLEEISTLLRDAGVVGSGVASTDEAGAGLDLDRPIAQLPGTLRGLVAARLDALAVTERRMIDDAAVLGRGGSRADLFALGSDGSDGAGAAALADADARAGGGEGAELSSAFQRLVDKDLLVTDGRSWWFRSDLVRDVAYQMLTRVERARRHLNIANWLASEIDNRPQEYVAVVADHYASAVETGSDLTATGSEFGPALVDLAVEWLGRAGEQAAERESHYAAERVFQRAIEMLGEADPRLIAMALGRGNARLGLRELTGARADAELARALATLSGDRLSSARGLRLLGEIAASSDEHSEAEKLLAESLERFTALGEVREAADALRLRGVALMRGGDFDRADRYLNEAHATLGHLGDEIGVAWCLENLAWLSFQRGHIDEAHERVELAISRFNDVGDRRGVAASRALLAFLLFYVGEREDAERMALEVREEVSERGDRFVEALMELLLGSISLWSGRAAGAIDRAKGAEGVFRKARSEFGVVQSQGLLGRAYAAVGELHRSQAVLAECLQRALDMPGRPLELFARGVRAGGSVQMGNPESAIDDIERLASQQRGVVTGVDGAVTAVGQAGVGGQPVGAGASSDSLAKLIAGRRQTAGGSQTMIGTLDLEVSLGMAQLQLGQADEAVAALEAVWQHEQQAATRPMSLYLASSLALAYAAVGRTEDALEQARVALARGTGTYLDVRTALLARAFAFCRQGDRAAMEAAFAQALVNIDGTDSRLSQAIVRLAHAIGAEACDSPEAASLHTEAEAALTALGARPTGWERAFRLAADVEPVRSSQPGLLPEPVPYKPLSPNEE